MGRIFRTLSANAIAACLIITALSAPSHAQTVKKPTKEGEVTVVLKNGAQFRGLLVIETDEIIKIKTDVAEMTWPKNQLKEIFRYTAPPTPKEEPQQPVAAPRDAAPAVRPPEADKGGGEKPKKEDEEERYTDVSMYLTPSGYAAPKITLVKSGTVRISIDGIKDAGYSHYTPRWLAEGIMENSPYKVAEAGAVSADATLQITMTGTPLAATYFNLGKQYTGAKIEGTVTFTCPNGSASAKFEGKVSPPSTIGYSPGNPVKADPKFAPYGEAFENSNCMDALADAVSRGSGVNKAKLLTGYFHWSDQSPARRRAIGLARKMGREGVPGLVEIIGEKGAGLDAYKVIESAGPDAVPELAAALKHPNKYVRRVASYFLVVKYPDQSQQYFPAIADLMLDCIVEENIDSQLFAIKMLARLGPDGSKGAARIAEFAANGQTDVRLTFLTAMKKMGPHAQGAVPVLQRILNENKTFSSRSNSAEALGYIGRTEKEARDVLAEALFHQDRSVQSDAAEALGDIGAAAADAVPALAKLVESKNNAHFNEAPRAALQALGKIGRSDEKARLVLAEALKSNNRVIREEAGRALGDSRSDSTTTTGAVSDALKDARPEVREDAAKALGRMGDKGKDGIPALISALQDDNNEVRTAAVRSLKEMGPDAKEAVPALIHVLEKPGFTGVWAAGTLVEIAADDPRVHTALADALKHDNDNVRRAAAVALGNIGPPAQSTVSTLAEALGDAHGGVRVAAAEALGRMGPAAGSAVPALGRALTEDRERWVRKAAAEALGKMGAPAGEAAETLAKALQDKDDVVYDAAKESLVALGPAAKGAVPVLGRYLADNETRGVACSSALAVLGSVGAADAEARAALAAATTGHKEERIRWGAIHALSKCGPAAKDAVPALIKALEDAAPKVREIAASILGGLGGEAKEAVPALKNVSENDPRPGVRSAAKYALERIER
ncbi:MAG: HEAT repeat domain-containing protein [Planctomycetota bacterium]